LLQYNIRKACVQFLMSCVGNVCFFRIIESGSSPDKHHILHGINEYAICVINIMSRLDSSYIDRNVSLVVFLTQIWNQHSHIWNPASSTKHAKVMLCTILAFVLVGLQFPYLVTGNISTASYGQSLSSTRPSAEML